MKTASLPTNSILVLHGPNLNLLGTREPEVYGRTTLAEIDAGLVSFASKSGVSLQALQSNAEVDLIERIHQARLDGTSFIIINPQPRLPTPVWHCAMLWQRWRFHLLKCIYQMSLRGKRSAKSRIFLI